MTGQHVAVTGATGFLGFHLVRKLVERGHDVTAIVRRSSDTSRLGDVRVAVSSDLNSPSQHGQATQPATALAAAMSALTETLRGCDVIYHLAGAVDFGGDWERFYRVNVGGTRALLDAAQAAGVRRFVHCSSIVTVGATRRPVRLDETTRWNLDCVGVPYVTTKRQAETLALASDRPGFEVVVANLACLVGPDDFTASEFGTLCHRFWRGRIPIHFGGGNNFVDVRDAADGLIAAATHGRPGERYILGGVNRTMSAFFSELAKVAGRAIPRLRLPSGLGGVVALLKHDRGRKRALLSPAQARLLPYFFFYECAKARRELGFLARPLSESLRDAHAFWCQAERRAA